MSEEEKKAIEIVQGLKVYYDDDCLLDEEELEENKTVNNAIDTAINLIEKQQKEIEHWKAGMKIVERDKNNHIERLENELDKTTYLLSCCNKRLEDIARELTAEIKIGYDYTEIMQEIQSLKENECTATKCQMIKEKYISKDKIKELLENEIIDISGFRCIAVEDIEELLEEK